MKKIVFYFVSAKINSANSLQDSKSIIINSFKSNMLSNILSKKLIVHSPNLNSNVLIALDCVRACVRAFIRVCV